MPDTGGVTKMDKTVFSQGAHNLERRWMHEQVAGPQCDKNPTSGMRKWLLQQRGESNYHSWGHGKLPRENDIAV